MIKFDEAGAYEVIPFSFDTPRTRPIVKVEKDDCLLTLDVKDLGDYRRCSGCFLRRRREQARPEIIVEEAKEANDGTDAGK